jgi:hypothetical protein
MKVGILPGDLTISIDESGSTSSNAILSTAYNVLPIWLRIASDQLRHAKRASEAIATEWGANDEVNRELLLAELEPSLQVFVACGIAVDALYDQLRPFAKLSEADIQAWRTNGTARDRQILEVIRRVYKLGNEVTAQFGQNITEIVKYRDLAVHPSLELKRTCTRPDVPVGVDWKFAAYRYPNAASCFEVTMKTLLYLYERKTENDDSNQRMDNIVKALVQLQVVTRNPPAGQSTGCGE